MQERERRGYRASNPNYAVSPPSTSSNVPMMNNGRLEEIGEPDAKGSLE